ncbi:unnamed protein product, partial [Timema podura]|nr:unnamed protein product [Timema podura]
MTFMEYGTRATRGSRGNKGEVVWLYNEDGAGKDCKENNEGEVCKEKATSMIKKEMRGADYSKCVMLRGHDPSVNVVLMEDFAAVIGVGVAATCMGLTSYLGSPIPDAMGSLLVGGVLGGVASFIIYTNVAALVGRYI